MEMLASVKGALTGQCPRLPEDLRNMAAAEEATWWINLFKGLISKQQTERQREHMGANVPKKRVQ